MTAPVLAEALGPRAARQVRVASVVAAGLVAAAVAVALVRLADKGQLDAELWRPLTDPPVIGFLLGGLANTLRAAVAAMVASLMWGLVLALGRLSPRAPLRWLAGTYIEFFRSVPLVLLVLFCALGLPLYGLDLRALWYLVLALTIYNGAVLAEILRAGVLALDRGQSEAAASIGLGYWPSLFVVVLPQAARRMVPAIASQLITLLKDTSLGAVIPYEELLRRGRITGEYNRAPLQALFAVAVMYIVVNFTLSRLAGRFETRRRAPTEGEPGALEPELVATVIASAGSQRWRRPPGRRRS